MNIPKILVSIVFILVYTVLVRANQTTTKKNLRDERDSKNSTARLDAWEAILITMDICVSFTDNPSDSTEGITFYSEMNSNGEMRIDGEIPDSFIQGAPLKIIVHGFRSTHENYNYFHSEFKKNPLPVNVILVKWDAADTNLLNYCPPAKETQRVGYNIARLLEYLIEKNSTHPYVEKETIHLIGHSLGAHAVGFAGKYFEEMGLGKINRITGMDPAFPGFRNNEYKISKTDAEIVDIIHSNGQVEDEFQNQNNIFHLGFSEPLGHYDFYPNGGYNQPGCNSQFNIDCSHSRSTEIFGETIQNSDKPFFAQKCGSYEAFIGRTLEGCGEMAYNYPGDNLLTNVAEGQYYFCTNSAAPFDKGEEAGIKCKPTVCDMYKKKGPQGTFSNIDGLHMSLHSFKYSEEIMPNDKEFVGVDEIQNISPATVTQVVTHSKRTYEKTELVSSKYWGKISQVCAQHAWGGTPGCYKFKNECDSTEPTILRTETESEFSLTREVIIPPFTSIHICSTLSVSKDVDVEFEATARYTGEGLWAEEIVRILAADGIEAIIDKSGSEEAAIAVVMGSVRISLALEPQFVVSDISEDGQSLCTSISRVMQQRKLMKSKSGRITFNEVEYNELGNQLDKLIFGKLNKNMDE